MLPTRILVYEILENGMKSSEKKCEAFMIYHMLLVSTSTYGSETQINKFIWWSAYWDAFYLNQFTQSKAKMPLRQKKENEKSLEGNWNSILKRKHGINQNCSCTKDLGWVWTKR